MKRIRISENFYLDEFVHPDIYKKFGSKSIWYIDHKIVRIAQALRTDLGKPITINNWGNGGSRKFSGLRPMDASIGAKYSQHKYGRAIDPMVSGITPVEVVEYILANEDRYMGYGLTTIENPKHTPTWTHLDTRETAQSEILFVNP